MTARRRQSDIRRVAIVGVGLIGGSLACALKKAQPALSVVGIDRSPRALGHLPLDRVGRSIRGVVGADVVVLAAPVDANLALLEEVVSCADAGATIIDVGSTKRAIVRKASALGVSHRFVGGHPMAGLAVSGAAHAASGLFRRAPWLLTPVETTERVHLERARRIARVVGARPMVIDAAEHDRVLAQVSHLPQLVSSALMQAVGESVGAAGLALSGPGLVDMTRLAASEAALWTAILAQNADEVGPALERLGKTLGVLGRHLRSLNRAHALFHSAQAWRATLERATRRGRR